MAKKRLASISEGVRASLLKVGTTLEQQGKLHQALTPYLELVEFHPDGEEAENAAERVLAIAEALRAKGQYHVAMRVLDRLQEAHQAGQKEEEG
jgi:tetratricopeptide (TPR) repeat protein